MFLVISLIANNSASHVEFAAHFYLRQFHIICDLPNWITPSEKNFIWLDFSNSHYHYRSICPVLDYHKAYNSKYLIDKVKFFWPLYSDASLDIELWQIIHRECDVWSRSYLNKVISLFFSGSLLTQRYYQVNRVLYPVLVSLQIYNIIYLVFLTTF